MVVGIVHQSFEAVHLGDWLFEEIVAEGVLVALPDAVGVARGVVGVADDGDIGFKAAVLQFLDVVLGGGEVERGAFPHDDDALGGKDGVACLRVPSARRVYQDEVVAVGEALFFELHLELHVGDVGQHVKVKVAWYDVEPPFSVLVASERVGRDGAAREQDF